MKPTESACRDVVASIDGVLLHTLLDLEAGVQLGVLDDERALESTDASSPSHTALLVRGEE